MTASPNEPLARPGEAFHAKWMFDGAETLEQVAEKAENFASWLRTLGAAGWTLTYPVEDGHGYLTDPTGDSGPTADDE